MNSLSDEAFEARIQERRERMDEIAPLLGALMTEARTAYDLLRPKARFVGEVAMNYPIRYQQVHGLSFVSGVGLAPIADYIMLRIRDHDNITIEKRVEDGQLLWRFEHTQQIAPLLSVNTKVEEKPKTSRQPDNGFEFNVATYAYHEVWGRNPSFRDNLCGFFEAYPGAEDRIAAVSAELNLAIEQNQG